MSIVTFKKRSIHKHGGASRISGKPTSQHWAIQGPFGQCDLSNTMMLGGMYSGVSAGFSLNGGQRQGGIGKDMKQSHSGTPFRGVHPVGFGGRGGTYVQPNPLFNIPPVKAQIRGTQDSIVKPSVVSARGQMRRRYRVLYASTFPSTVVQPIFTGNQTDNTSSGLYTQRLGSAHLCSDDIGFLGDKYKGYKQGCVGRGNSTATNGILTQSCGGKGGGDSAAGTYTKNPNKSISSSEQTARLGRECGLAGSSIAVFPGTMGTSAGCYSGQTKTEPDAEEEVII